MAKVEVGYIIGEIPIHDLPLYSYDDISDYPEVAKRFKSAIGDTDAVLFVTPEDNRSMPGGLTNAIDSASRPYGQNAFTGKPPAVIGTAPGSIGTTVDQLHSRGVVGFRNSPQMNAPEAYIQFKPDLISNDGELSRESTGDCADTTALDPNATAWRLPSTDGPERAVFDVEASFVVRGHELLPPALLARSGFSHSHQLTDAALPSANRFLAEPIIVRPGPCRCKQETVASGGRS
jgi:chromate reductase